MDNTTQRGSQERSTADAQWLTSEDAAAAIELARAAAEESPALVERLRRQWSAAQVRLVLEQVALRRRGKIKFAAANRMFFTPLGLEQATDEIVAAYKAARFQAAGRAMDLCTGIGGDLLALVRVSSVVGVDRDPYMAEIAKANLRLIDQTQVGSSDVRWGDACSADVSECDAWHIDPDRRATGKRTTRVELYEPTWESIALLLSKNPNAAVKLAPAARLSAEWSEQAELEWISRDGECRQQVAWFGSLAKDGGKRRASILNKDGLARFVVGFENAIIPVGPMGKYIYEPDVAVLAAGLGGVLAAEQGLSAVASGTAYWTSDTLVIDRALAAFEVQEVLPFAVKRLKSLLRSRNIGALEIKKRGVQVDPEILRRQLALEGDQSATLLIARVQAKTTAILANRL